MTFNFPVIHDFYTNKYVPINLSRIVEDTFFEAMIRGSTHDKSHVRWIHVTNSYFGE